MSDTTITLRVPEKLLQKWDAHCNTIDDLDEDAPDDFKELVANTQTKYPSRSQLIRDSVQLNINSEFNTTEQTIETDALEDKLDTLNSTIRSMDTKLDSVKLQLQDYFEETVPDNILNDILQKIPQISQFNQTGKIAIALNKQSKESLVESDEHIGWLSKMKMKLEYDDDMIEQALTQLVRDIDDVNEFEYEDGDKFYWKSEFY